MAAEEWATLEAVRLCAAAAGAAEVEIDGPPPGAAAVPAEA